MIYQAALVLWCFGSKFARVKITMRRSRSWWVFETVNFDLRYIRDRAITTSSNNKVGYNARKRMIRISILANQIEKVS
jgi:hypothetical protein